jgi:cytochrome P450
MLSHSALHFLAPALFTERRGLPESIPGPPPSRFLSTAGALIPWAKDSLGHASHLFERYGPVVALVRGGGMRHISTDPACPGTVLAYGAEAVERATMDHDTYTKMTLVGALHPGPEPPLRKRALLSFGAGLFAVNGDQHRRHRRLLSPAFSRKRLASYAEDMVSLTDEALSSLQVGEVRAIDVDMRTLTSRIVARTLLGESENAETELASVHLTQAIRLLGNPLTRLLPFDAFGLPYRKYLNATLALEEEMLSILEARKRAGPTGERGDMLEALLTAHDEETDTRLTDHEILGHVSIFFAAGHETSANALSWTLFLLALFPEVSARVSEEVDRVLGGAPPTPDDLDKLVYLGWVIKESLRLFTPAPWNGRVLSEDVELLGHTVPKGAEVLVSLYQTHRVPEVFREPNRFWPERWETLKPTAYEYNPFSAGPRTCIGAAFATMEIKIVLAMMFQRYRFALVPQTINRFAELVLAPTSLRMKVEPKDGRFGASAARIAGDLGDMINLPQI